MHGVTAEYEYEHRNSHTRSNGSDDSRALFPGGQEFTTIDSCLGYIEVLGRIVVYLANQNNLITDVHFYDSGMAQHPVHDGSAHAAYTSQ